MISPWTYRRPVLLAGNGVRAAGAAGLLHAFVRKTHIPLLTTMNGVDLAQDGLHIGFIGTHGNRAANLILSACDLVIAVGARLGIRQVGKTGATFAPRADLVRCDIDAAELARTIKPGETKCHTGARTFLQELLAENVPDYSGWLRRCLRAKALLAPYDRQPGNEAIEAISALLPPDPVVAVDVGMNQCWCAQSLHLRGDKGRILLSGGYGTMGCALPFAIGASIANGNSPVYCIAGDGGFQMNIQELETVRREGLPIKMFILDNRVLGKISETQHYKLDDRFTATTGESGYTVPDFTKLAQAYGLRAAALASYKDLPRYQDWITDNEPCLLDIPLPEQAFLTPKMDFETGEMSPALDEHLLARVREILNG